MSIWRFVNKKRSLILESTDLKFLVNEVLTVHGATDDAFMTDLIIYGRADFTVRNKEGEAEEAYIEELVM